MNNPIYKRNSTKGGIYSITQLSSGKRYVGCTARKFSERKGNHFWDLRNGTHPNTYLQATWSKYGEPDFVFEILEIVEDLEDVLNLYELEFQYITKHRSSHRWYGFNLMEDSRFSGVGKHSEETKAKISKAHKGRNAGIKPQNFEEFNRLNWRPVHEFLNGEFVREHVSGQAAGTFHNIDYKSVNNSCRGLTKTMRLLPNTTFKYADGKPTRGIRPS